MALREVLKCDTSTQTHAAQSAEADKEHEKEKLEGENGADNSAVEKKAPRKENSPCSDSDDVLADDKESCNLEKKGLDELNAQNDSGIEPGTVSSA